MHDDDLYRLTIAVDFNGVIHDHDVGSKGAIELGSPEIPGAIDWLKEVSDSFNVALQSARFGLPGPAGPSCIQSAKRWLIAKGIPPSWVSHDPDTVCRRIHLTDRKVKYHVLLDDRAITFRGRFPSAEDLMAFKPWNR